MKEKDYIKWRKTRKLGRLIYTLIYTITFAVAVSSIAPIVTTLINQQSWITFEELLPVVLEKAPYYSIIGLIISQAVWTINEKKFAEGCKMCSGNQPT